MLPNYQSLLPCTTIVIYHQTRHKNNNLVCRQTPDVNFLETSIRLSNIHDSFIKQTNVSI